MVNSESDMVLQYGVLAEEASAHGLTDLAARARQRQHDLREPLLIMVVGEGKFGKSSLINALLGTSVAPVSRLPKTWKVDLYEPTRGEETATLFWRSRPGSEDVASMRVARAVCEEQERRAEAAATTGRKWQSDLYQVKWKVQCGWIPQGATLVDTPVACSPKSGPG